jgi:hypothetical protein
MKLDKLPISLHKIDPERQIKKRYHPLLCEIREVPKDGEISDALEEDDEAPNTVYYL